ncbi:MAG: hypothetical protein QM346_13000, partial [Chloroflexota bacterium]|nr:hypothetical protein [Chloroflexota bacterium]
MGSTTEFILWTEGRDGKQPEPILFIASDENPSEDWTQVDRAFAPEDTPAGAPVDAPVGGPVGGPVSSGMDAAPDAAPDAGPVSSFGPARIVASDGTGVSTPDAAPVDNRMRLLEADPRYREAMDRMQFGQWPEVRDLLAELQTDYPHEPALDALLNEAQLRADLVIRWGTKIRGRRLTVGQQRFLRRSLPFVLLIGLVIAGWAFYNSYVAPSRRVVAMANAIQNMAAEAQTLVQNARYEEALLVYERILVQDPANAAAIQGLAETREMMGLSAQFDLAMQLANEGKIERALAFLAAIQERSPGFRNVDVQIEQLQAQDEARLAFEQADMAFARQQWLEAIALYEQAAAISADYRADAVAHRLDEAYFHAGMQLVSSVPAPDAGPEQAYDYLRQGKSADPAAAEAELGRLDAYFKGKKSLDAGNLEQAINLWRSLYDAQPDYLGGYLAGRLYAAYLSLASRAQMEGNLVFAASLYEQAAALQVDDVSGALTRLEALRAAVTPTPQPAPRTAAVYSPAQAPAPTPAPDYRGMIAFRTNRNGKEEIYLMRPDGSEQQPAPPELAARFEEMLYSQMWSPDATRLARVRTPEGRNDANIYVMDMTVPEDQRQDVLLTDFRGDEYDPVWSLDGQRIAFVSNHTGNDEIWSVRADGTDAVQLTRNNWEWDKRPSWSQDGSRIVFYSNRTGWRQIWVMDNQGGTQLNLS